MPPRDAAALGLRRRWTTTSPPKITARRCAMITLYPMAAAIWSTPAGEIGKYPAASFIRFCDNHGLLRLSGRPVWRTVDGGSQAYIARLTQPFADRIATGRGVRMVRRQADAVEIIDDHGRKEVFDHVVIGATHADQALAMLADPSSKNAGCSAAFGCTGISPSSTPIRRGCQDGVE